VAQGQTLVLQHSRVAAWLLLLVDGA
jgi:hypothetical protein